MESTSRFRLERCLGRGGFGVVYLAHDLKRRSEVALKMLTNMEPGGLYWFKQEFRSLADLRHPNLVQLYELLSEGDQWCFTMELVDGVDFRRYVCRAGSAHAEEEAPTTRVAGDAPETHVAGRPAHAATHSYDANRLRAALRQLTEGVHALHAAGKLHRDLKPSNVLVTHDGRVVILDFGLARDLNEEGLAETFRLMGTPPYMSPEQSTGSALTVASDWYSVGLMLYETLTGNLPFRGSVGTILLQKQEWEPADGHLPPDTPPDLAGICKDLLFIDPDRRIRAEEILARLSPSESDSRPTARRTARSGALFVGRRKELVFLHGAVGDLSQRAPTTILLHGSSGIGKTALAHQFLDELRARQPDAIILRARCYEQESVPYKGLDTLVDSLVQYLRSVNALELERILPRELHALERLFPVMEEIASQVAPWRPAHVTDPWEFRRRGARALRELLARLADLRQLVLFIDDVHWGDADSARLLQDILRPPDPPALLLLVSYRTEEAETSPYVRELLKFSSSGDSEMVVRELPLKELSSEETDELALALSSAASLSVEERAQIAKESDGSPFFVQELVRHREETVETPHNGGATSGKTATLEGLMESRLSHLDADARELLELLAVSGRPIESEALVRAAGSAGHAAALDRLKDRHLIRSRSGDVEEIEIYHARMAKGVLMHVPEERLTRLHYRLAVAQEEIGGADAETLYRHYHEAGERSRAAVFAVAAAEEASNALAFNRAAELYARALEDHPPDAALRRNIRVRLGDALATAGRGEEAARAFLDAAEDASLAERLRLQEKAMGQFFRTGRFDEGLAVLRAILPALRLKWPDSQRQALLALLVRRLRLRVRGLSFRERDRASVSSDDLVRIDACWSVSTGLSVVENVRAALFQTQALLWALDTGEPLRIMRAMALEAAFSALGGSRTRRRTEELFGRVSELTARINTPELQGLVMVARGVSFHLCGEWKRAAQMLFDAEKLLSQHASEVVQELDNTRVFGLFSLAQMGRFRELSARLPALLADAEERGDLYAKTMFSFRSSFMHLVTDNPSAARSVSAQAVAGWSRAGFHATHYGDLQCQGNAELYSAEPEKARQRMIEIRVPLRRSRFLRLQLVSIEVAHLRARTCLALAAKGLEVGPMLRAADREARVIERQAVPWGIALAILTRAGIAATVGDTTKAVSLLTAAEEALSSADMLIHAAAARYRRGELIGGASGQALVADAQARMHDEGIVNPSRYVAMLVPGKFARER